MEISYGDMVFKSGDITKSTKYYFNSLKELLDFRETMEQEHIVLFQSLMIKVEKYVEFERWMVEGGHLISYVDEEE
tara:strand:- start:35 stop:262 length:228 start_codon:yes stop_codon:yes gene_type:complete